MLPSQAVRLETAWKIALREDFKKLVNNWRHNRWHLHNLIILPNTIAIGHNNLELICHLNSLVGPVAAHLMLIQVLRMRQSTAQWEMWGRELITCLCRMQALQLKPKWIVTLGVSMQTPYHPSMLNTWNDSISNQQLILPYLQGKITETMIQSQSKLETTHRTTKSTIEETLHKLEMMKMWTTRTSSSKTRETMALSVAREAVQLSWAIVLRVSVTKNHGWMIDLTQTERAREGKCPSWHRAGRDLKLPVPLGWKQGLWIKWGLLWYHHQKGISTCNLASKSKWIIIKRSTETWRAKIELLAMAAMVYKRIVRNLKFSIKKGQLKRLDRINLETQNNRQQWEEDHLLAKMNMDNIIKGSLIKDQNPTWDTPIRTFQWGTLKDNGLQASKTL